MIKAELVNAVKSINISDVCDDITNEYEIRQYEYYYLSFEKPYKMYTDCYESVDTESKIEWLCNILCDLDNMDNTNHPSFDVILRELNEIANTYLKELREKVAKCYLWRIERNMEELMVALDKYPYEKGNSGIEGLEQLSEALYNVANDNFNDKLTDLSEKIDDIQDNIKRVNSYK